MKSKLDVLFNMSFNVDVWIPLDLVATIHVGEISIGSRVLRPRASSKELEEAYAMNLAIDEARELEAATKPALASGPTKARL